MPYEKVGKNEPVCIADKVPFEIPDNWEWVRLATVNDMYTGNSINENEKKQKYMGLIDGYCYIGTKDVGFDHSINYDNGVRIPYSNEKFRMAPRNSILLCIEGGSAGRKISFTNKDICFGNKLCCFISYGVDYKFLYYYLQSPLFQSAFKENTTGIIGGVSVNTLKNMFLPVPPVEEQQRIVQEILKLEPYIEQYRISEETIAKLNSSFPEQLKKSILQEAVQGKLVPQDENDEPASVLLERIRAEKQKLIAEDKIKKDKHESVIFRRDNSHYEKLDGIERCIDDEIPFEIPENWCWSRLNSIVFNHGQMTPAEEFCYIDIGSIDNIHQQLNENENIIEATKAPSRARKIVEFGDILYSTVRPYLHNMCIVDKIFSCKPIASTGFAVMCSINGIYNKYLFYHLLSPIFDSYANNNENSKGVAYPAINDDKLYKALIPIPPLNEQYRIVEVLEKLLPYCKKI